MTKKKGSPSSAGTYIYLPICALLLACTPAEQASEAPTADIIVEGSYVVTMDENQSVIKDGAVAIKDGLIIALAPTADINSRYTAAEHIKGDNRIVMPGLVNGHSHAAMTLLRGVADDMALMEWLNNYIFPAEVEFVDPDFVRIGTVLACWEMIRGGTTTFVDMYYFPDIVAEVVESCGMRAMVSATVIDQRSPDAENASDSIRKGLEFIGRWKDKNSRITPIFGPHAKYTLNAAQLKATRAAADEAGVAISIHMSESPFELQYSKDTFGMTSIEFFESIGFLDGPTIAAHVVWPTEAEIPVLAERRVGVIHNPSSNMKIASGVSPVTEMLRAGVLVGLGTDGAASNNDQDLLGEMRSAALLAKGISGNASSCNARQSIEMATINGARALGLGDQIGSIEVGKCADLIAIDLDALNTQPVYDPVAQIVYAASSRQVSHVWIDGKLQLQDFELCHLDSEQIIANANAWAQKLNS